MKRIFRDGFVGIFAAAAGTGLSYFEKIEAWLRIVSLIMGILVAALMAVSLIQKIRRRHYLTDYVDKDSTSTL